MRKPSGTDGSLLQSLPWTLLALSIAIAPHVPYVPIWITGAFILCAYGRWYIEKNRKRLPPTAFRVVLALLCFVGVLATYENITGVGPGSALLVIMAAMKLMETRKRRDQFVLLFISVFLVMSTLLREQQLWSLPYLLISTGIIMTAWLRMSANSDISVKRSFATSSRLIMIAAPLALAMWVFFPRLSAPFWAVPVDSTRAKSGLSDTMSPGDISSLSLSNKVAFRVDFEDRVPTRQQLYFRGLVLHHFNGRTWTGNDASTGPREQWPIEYYGEPYAYQITLEPTAQHWIYALDIPFDWDVDKTMMGQQQQLLRSRPIDQRISYRAVSYPEYEINPDDNPRRNDYYSRLPPDSNPRSVALATQMRAAAGSDAQYINDVLRMFNEQEFYYTLQPPALGGNPVDQFLLETRQGFCEHYASAFAVMMRAVDIPARIVLGYQGGEFNAMGDYLIVRQSDAHAWTELWRAGRGWVRVDPTAAVAPERINNGIADMRFNEFSASWGFGTPSLLLHKMTLVWDAINAKWNEWVLGYGPDNQNSLMKWLGMDDPDWQKMMFTLLAIVAGMIMLISALLMLRYRPPPKDRAAIIYESFRARAGVVAHKGETPYIYALRVNLLDPAAEQKVDRVTSCYLEARYGTPDDNSIARLQNAVRDFSTRQSEAA